MDEFRVLELFSGIGGMHFALKCSQVPGEVVAAVDINTVANVVYSHNHPEIPLLNNNIQKLQSQKINKMNVNTILMSPPCQPFTRVGNQKDVDDYRSDALKHLCDILPELKTVDNILMENVKGFEKSRARDLYVECLKTSNFDYREFILSPTQFGVPNTRHRYFCIARRSLFGFGVKGTLQTELPDRESRNSPGCATVRELFDPESDVLLDKYLIPDTVLVKRVNILDIVTPDDKNTMCFTKAYTHYCEGTGSVFTSCSRLELDATFPKVKSLDTNSSEYLELLKALKLRYFTPKEVSRLMSFPSEFSFPEETSDRQRYRLLGNSINVLVVSELIKLLAE